MHHAVILAHPVRTSFCASIAAACIDTLSGLGHTAQLRDLYALDFDPRLKASEVPLEPTFTPAEDVVAERAILGKADSFIFVYPFWFNAPPAILKGYVDRVFGMGFAYGPAFGSTTPLLGGKTLSTISTSGATDAWVNSTGALKTLMQGFDLHVAAVCGLKVLDHHHLGGVVHNMRQDAAVDLLAEVAQRLKKTFRASAPA